MSVETAHTIVWMIAMIVITLLPVALLCGAPWGAVAVAVIWAIGVAVLIAWWSRRHS